MVESEELEDIIRAEAARAKAVLRWEEFGDLVQVGWCVALKIRRGYRPERGPFGAYLRVSLRRAYRKLGRRAPPIPVGEPWEGEEEEPPPLPSFDEEAYLALIQALCALHLPRRALAAFFLASGLMDGVSWTQAEGTWILGLKGEQFRTAFARAKRAVRESEEVRICYARYVGLGD